MHHLMQASLAPASDVINPSYRWSSVDLSPSTLPNVVNFSNLSSDIFVMWPEFQYSSFYGLH